MSLLSLVASAAGDKAANTLAAARALAPALARGRSLDRRAVAEAMTISFGGSDAEGAWTWKDAYDAVEAAQVLQVRRLGAQVARLEDAPADVVALLEAISRLALSQTRRSEEQVALDQFSTPPEIAALAVLAAQVRLGDKVLEPSAGTGLLAVVAEACGAELTLNEPAEHRAGLLDGLFPAAARLRQDARRLKDLCPASGGFEAAVLNPPFQDLAEHLDGALACLADGGRMAAIVPAIALEDGSRAGRLGSVVARVRLPARAFARHGTSVETGLLVIDRGARGERAPLFVAEDLEEAARLAAAVPPRPTAKPRLFRTVALAASMGAPGRGRAAAGRLAHLQDLRAVEYELKAWSGEGRDVGLYQAYALGRIAIPGATRHPSPLVESAPMASVAPPAPSYRPLLPARVVEEGLVSDAQLESVIYAGGAHAEHLPGRWVIGEAAHQALLARDEAQGAQFRRGFFIGDGTGCGKGREIAAVILDNMAQGRVRAVWISRNDALLENARRDWRALGGSASDVVAQGGWRQGDAIRLDRGVLFTTYATRRQPARAGRPSRLDQIVTWLGEGFDGAVVFDEAHAMANATGGGRGARGPKKASLQGMAGLALQNRLPDARVLYVSATGATAPENLAYAARLGLWGGPDAPFPTREAFMDAVETGGVAAMELIARELKAMGLYVARALSFEGLEYEPLRHELTADDIAIWDAWAGAYQLIHRNLRAALEAVGVTEDGKPRSGQAASAALSAFESAKLRFFGHLLAGLKAPSLIAAIRRDVAEARSAVVQIVSTNEAVMERRLAEIPPSEWNNLSIDLTPKDQVLDYLTGAFPIHAMDAVEDEEGTDTLVPVLCDGRPVVSQEAVRLRDELVAGLACLPAAPCVLDALLEAFGTDQVAEITGRSRRVVFRDGRKVVERRSGSAAAAETQAFMSGRKRILVFSDAGGTGRSYHADLAAENRQRRVHYLVEPGWRADAAIQGLGRSHRTNQAHAPLLRPVTTDIQGEKRFLSTIARRLDSLGALTRGERRAAGAGLFRAEDCLESPWAHRALLAFYGALDGGSVRHMSRDVFEAKTGLRLTDGEGALKEADDLPPMNTFLNRLLALPIADQNGLFQAFDEILSGILERAQASGALDRGVEDLVADELHVMADEVIRTDARTGAETRLTTFDVRSRRRLRTADEAMAETAGAAVETVLNARSQRAALAVQGLTTTDDEDRLVRAVRVVRPDSRSLVPLKAYEESAWTPVDGEAWRRAWDGEIAEADPWSTRRVVLVTGLLLPVWSHLPHRHAHVRRLKAPDGRRWLGRVIDETQVPALKLALGASDLAAELSDGRRVSRLVLEQGHEIALAGGLWLRRARVMDRRRIEVVGGAAHRAVLVQLGCFVEIISYAPRVFAPVGRAEVIEAVLSRWPPHRLLPAAA
jgi:hypothetical protein